jgi:hypothetical protein
MKRAKHMVSTANGPLLVHKPQQPKNPPPQERPLTVPVSEACRLSGLGATSIWKFIRDGRLETVHVAGIKRTLIIYGSLERLLAPALSSPAAPRKRRLHPAESVSLNSSTEVV